MVVDSSVLVAAAWSRNEASCQLVPMLPPPHFEFSLAIALYTEWQATLTRAEHLPPGVTVDATLGYLRYLSRVPNEPAQTGDERA